MSDAGEGGSGSGDPRDLADVGFRGVTPMLQTADLGATVEFYTELLGFVCVTLWPEDDPTFCILDRDDVHLSFYVDEHHPEAEATMTGQLSIDVDDAMAIHDRIAERVEVLWGPEVYWYGRREFSIRDPNGYALVFSEPTDDAATCEG